jgi:hypothetical protein
MDDRFLELYDRYCDGALTPDEQEEFLALLDDAAWRARFVELAVLEASVTEELRLRGLSNGTAAEDPVAACAAAGLEARSREGSTHSSRSRRRLAAVSSSAPRPWIWTALAAAAVLLVLLPWLLGSRQPARPDKPDRVETAERPETPIRPVDVPAEDPAPVEPATPEPPVAPVEPVAPPAPETDVPGEPAPVVAPMTPDPIILDPPPQPWRRNKKKNKNRKVETKPTAPVKTDRPSEVAVAQVVEVRGKVQVIPARKSSKKSSARPEQLLYAGQGIHAVGANSRAVLEYPDGTVLELGPEAKLTKLAVGDDSGSGKSARLERGSIGAEVVPQPEGRPLVLTTAHAEARVVGTRFTLTVRDARSRLCVHQGEVRLSRLADGAMVRVGTGQFASVSPNGPLATVPLRSPVGLVALYTFEEGVGTVVRDVSGIGDPLPLRIAVPAAVRWVPGGLDVQGPAGISTFGPAEKIITACKASGELSIEAWVRPPDNARDGYVLALASNPHNLNVALEQAKSPPVYRVHLTAGRSRETGAALMSKRAPPPSTVRHVVYTYAADGKGTLYLDGVPRAGHRVPGGLSRWDTNFRLGLASDPRGNLPWAGVYHRLAVYHRALTSEEVRRHFEAGAN